MRNHQSVPHYNYLVITKEIISSMTLKVDNEIDSSTPVQTLTKTTKNPCVHITVIYNYILSANSCTWQCFFAVFKKGPLAVEF